MPAPPEDSATWEHHCGAACAPLGGYRRREPEKTLLHEVVRERLEPFLAAARERSAHARGLPGTSRRLVYRMKRPRGGSLFLVLTPDELRTFREMHGDVGRSLAGGEAAREDVDDRFAARSFENLGAWILGRNMFAPSRGPWPDDGWKGWWGENPPYHVPVFVLTHHARAPLTMEGGTTFHFVTDGIHAALERAREAARGKDVRLGGGAATVRQYLAAGLVDEVHLAISPVLLGRGEHLLAGIDLVSLGYRCAEHAATGLATHVVLAR